MSLRTLARPTRTARSFFACSIAALVVGVGGACHKSDGVTGPIVPPANSLLTTVGGISQVGAVGHTLAQQISVNLTTEDGVAVPGAVVHFKAAVGGGSVTPDSIATDVAGFASATWTLGGTLGTQSMVATINVGTVPPDTVTALAVANNPGPPVSIKLVSGDQQVALPNAALSDAMVVQVVDSIGLGVPNVGVAFQTGGDGQFVGGAAGDGKPISSSVTATTDTNGLARAQYKVGALKAIYGSSASVAGLTNKLYFTATSQNGPDVAAVTNVLVGRAPRGITANASTNRIYVSNNGTGVACDFGPSAVSGVLGNWVASINASATSNTVTQLFTTTSPVYALANGANNRLFIAGSTSLEVWDGGTNTVLAKLSALGDLRQVAINSTTNQIWVSAADKGLVYLVDGASNTVTTSVATGKIGPRGVAIDPSLNRIYTTDSTDNTVTVIDGSTKSVITHIPVGGMAVGIAVDTIAHKVYVSTGGYSGTVVVIDNTNTVVQTIAVNRLLGEVAVDPVHSRVYVVSPQVPYAFAVINGSTNALVGLHGTPRCPWGIAVNPATQLIYVASITDAYLQVLDATRVP